MNIVIVESAAKAKTINKYLGSDYKVIASFGHVRDLPSKDGSVEPDNDFNMHWDVDGKATKVMREIADAVKRPTSSSWPPTLIARARPFPGIFCRCWTRSAR